MSTRTSSSPDPSKSQPVFNELINPHRSVFASGQRLGLVRAPMSHWSQIWHRRSLISFIVSGNLRTKVINTLLGRLWHLIPPVVQIAVYFVVVNYIFGGGGTRPKTVFVTISVGILHWSFLNLCVSNSTTAITSNDSLLKQSPVPPVVFVGVLFREQLQHLGIKMGIMAVILLMWGPELSWRLALYPVWIGMLLLNTWSLGLMVATLSVFFRDLEKAAGLFILMMMYLCPVIYGVDFLIASIGPVPLIDVIMLNPFAVNFAMIKWSLLGSDPIAMWQLGLAACSSLGLFLFAHQVYERSRAKITKSL